MNDLVMILSYKLPFGNEDLMAIQDLLRERDIIQTVFPESQFDRYSFLRYSLQHRLHNEQFCALLDRNIFSYIISVVQNKTKKPTDTQKAACALMAFLQVTNTMIEPGLAIYEYIDSGHFEYADNELTLFRKADNVNPKYYVDIALGRSTTIPEEELNYGTGSSIKDMKGEDHFLWKLMYGSTLKMAIIERNGGTNLEKITSLLQWMYNEYMFVSAVIAFAIIYFSQKRYARMLKYIQNSQSEKLEQGLRNGTWDMHHVYYWAKKVLSQKQTNQIWLFCTEDKALTELSQCILSVDNSGEFKDFSFICNKYLGEKDGRKINVFYNSLMKDINNPKRVINSKPRATETIDKIIMELKRELFEK